MDDEEIAMIIRKRNQRYINHIDKQEDHFNPSELMRRDYNEEELEGGFLSAVASAARIAARLAMQAAKAAAKVAKAGARAAAKGAKAAAKQGAKASKAAARAAAKGARAAARGIKNNASDIADLALNVGMSLYDQAESIRENATLKASKITDEEWRDLDDNEKIFVDWNRWGRELDKPTYDLWMSRGGNKTAALQTLRLRDAGIDPDDWTAVALTNKMDSIADGIDEIDSNPAEEDEKCLELQDEDDRSDAEKIGLELLAVVDMGIGQAISEKAMEDRAMARYRDCVAGKKVENQKKRNGLMGELGLDGNAQFDPDDPRHLQKIADTMAAENPIFKLAMELDDLRLANGLPKIDASGNALKSPETIANNHVEEIAIYFINNRTLEYSDQPWIQAYIKDDPDIVQRAIARMKYYTTFCGNPPDIRDGVAFKKEYNSGDVADIGKVAVAQDHLDDWLNTEEISDAMDAAKQQVQGNDESRIAKGVRTEYDPNATYKAGDMVRSQNRVYKCIQDTLSYLPMITETELKNIEGYSNEERYGAGRIVNYNKKIYRMVNPTGGPGYIPGPGMNGQDMWQELSLAIGGLSNPNFWDEMNLYSDTDFKEIEQIGAATEWDANKKYSVDDYVLFAGKIFRMMKEAPAGVSPSDITEGFVNYDNGTNYAYPTIVLYDGKYYQKNQSVNAGPGYIPTLNGAAMWDLVTLSSTVWEEIVLNDPNNIYPGTQAKGIMWEPNTTYSKGSNLVWKYDNNKYTAIKDVPKDVKPDNTEYWKRLRTYNIDAQMETDLKISQRAAIFANAASVAEDYDPDNIYNLHQIVNGYDGKYYELIKLKVDKDGDPVPPPMPPEAKYWKLISDGLTEFDASKTYARNDMVLYKDLAYIMIKLAPSGTLPTNAEFWKPLDPIFEAMDEETLQANKDRYEQAVINTAKAYDDSPLKTYDLGDIVELIDNDGYPNYYRCIKEVLGAQVNSVVKEKAEEYVPNKQYAVKAVVKKDGLVYTVKAIKENEAIPPPPDTQYYTFMGYFDDPAPPNPEYWKSYNDVETQDEKDRDIRDTAIPSGETDAGLWLGDIAFDTESQEYYKLIKNPDMDDPESKAYQVLQTFKKLILTRKEFLELINGPYTAEKFALLINTWSGNTDMVSEDKWKEAISTIKSKYPTDDDITNNLKDIRYNAYNSINGWLVEFNNVALKYLLPFERDEEEDMTTDIYKIRPKDVYRWEPKEVKNRLQAKIDNIDAASIWKKTTTYKEGDLITDKYGLHYVCLATPPANLASLEPYYNTAYFQQLTNGEWLDAKDLYVNQIEEQVAKLDEYDDIAWYKSQWNKPRTFGEVVYYEGKHYSFIPFEGVKNGNTGNDITTTYTPNQKMIIDLNSTNVSSDLNMLFYSPSYPIIEYNQCTEDGTVIPVNYNDKFMYYAWFIDGPIVKKENKFYVYNAAKKEIFGFGDGKWNYYDLPLYSQYSFEWADTTGVNSYNIPKDTYWTEVYQDGKPVNKHDDTGAITGQNLDTSVLPPADAADVQDAVDKTTGVSNCPTESVVAEVDDDQEEEEATSSTYAKDLKAWETAHAEWVLKSPTDPTLAEPVKPVDPALVGKGIVKVKRKYVRKNKTIKK